MFSTRPLVGMQGLALLVGGGVRGKFRSRNGLLGNVWRDCTWVYPSKIHRMRAKCGLGRRMKPHGWYERL